MSSLLATADWPLLAQCKNTADRMFPKSEFEGGGLRRAKRTCAGCPVTAECLDDALTYHTWGRRVDGEGQGVRAGLSTTERRAVLEGASIWNCRQCGLLYANFYQTGMCHSCTPPRRRFKPQRSRTMAGVA